MPRTTDTLTYAQIKEALTAVSDDYANGGVSGALSAPAEEILQALWTQLRTIPAEEN
jgi:hypothetical protein